MAFAVQERPLGVVESVPKTGYTMFKEHATSQIAAYILHLMGGEMAADSLMLTIYLADKEHYRTNWYPITGDDVVSTGSGPELKNTSDIMHGIRPSEPWQRFISPVHQGMVTLIADVGPMVIYTFRYPGEDEKVINLGPDNLGKLMGSERNAADRAVAKRGNKNAWNFTDILDEFPEMQEVMPGDRIPIPVILRSMGYDADKIEAILEELEEREELDAIDAWMGARL